MQYKFRQVPELIHNRSFGTDREWLEHLRLIAELPYPSLALMPSILPIIRCRVSNTVGGFGWTDLDFAPLAYMTDQMHLSAYQWWASNLEVAFGMFPIAEQWASRGEMVRRICLGADFETSALFREVLVPQGLRWMTIAPGTIAGGTRLGFLSMYRPREAGPYTDREQELLLRAAKALAALDRPANPLSALPACPMREVAQASALVRADGSMAARSQEAARLIYLLGGANMHTLDWARPDWFALPASVREAAQRLFDHPDSELRQRVRIDQAWGRFEFALEKMPHQLDEKEPLVIIGIRYFEAVDITVARRLAGWPLSPREKSIVIAGTRSGTLPDLAEALGITVNTLKSYNKEIVDRLGVASRQDLIDLLLGEEAAIHDLAAAKKPDPSCC